MNSNIPSVESLELERLQSLLSYNILDTPKEEEFEGLVQLIAIICDVPTAIISLIDDKRQWYKAKIGIELDEVLLGDSFCQYTVVQDEILEITDTLLDERVNNNPYVTAEDGIRFYAGIPLRASDGHNIGTICVVDKMPKKLTEKQRKGLMLLTDQVMMLIEARRKNKRLGGELDAILLQKINDVQRKLLQKSVEFNELLHAIQLSNSVVEFSPEGKILKANEKFLNSVGYSLEELLGAHHAVLLNEEDKVVNNAFWQNLKNGNYKSGRVKRIAKDGSEVYLQASYNPILDIENQVVKVIKISQDITKETEAEQTIIQAKLLAERLNAQKDDFIANMSHELRTPIHAILGFTQLLMEQEVDHAKMNQLQIIKTAGDSLLYIINDILDLSKIESGAFLIDRSKFELQSLIKNVFSILHLKAHQKKINFNFEIDPEVPYQIVGDHNRLIQVLINLLGNAVKFTNQGGVHLHISVQENAENKYLKFIVSDTGIGVPSDKLDLIFERYSQADESISQKYGGTGLGLNISKQLIEKQQGTITVESELGVGSKFIFLIPLIKVQEAEINDIKQKIFNPEIHKELRILICEDNELNQRYLKAIFTNSPFNVKLAFNGIIGIEAFEQDTFDLVMMDLQMPEMDGYQATKHIRETLKSDVPIIAMTANFLFNEKEKCLKNGMNDYLSKPFSKDELFNKIGQWSDFTYNTEYDLKTTFTKDNEKIINLSTLEELSVGNENFMNELIGLFLRDGKIMYEQLESSCQNENWEVLKATAHKMKTSFGIVGADIGLLQTIEYAEKFTQPILEPRIEMLKEQLDQIYIALRQVK